MSLPYIGKCRLCGKEDEAVNEGICAAHSDEVAQAYLFGFADGKAQHTAQPDGVRRWRFVENYLGRACVAVEGSGELVLDTRTLDEQVSQACRLLVEAHNKALAAAPAREDGVRDFSVPICAKCGKSWADDCHSYAANACHFQALAAPAPAYDPKPDWRCKACEESGMRHCSEPDRCGNMKPPAPACKTCGGSKMTKTIHIFSAGGYTDVNEEQHPCPDCAKES